MEPKRALKVINIRLTNENLGLKGEIRKKVRVRVTDKVRAMVWIKYRVRVRDDSSLKSDELNMKKV